MHEMNRRKILTSLAGAVIATAPRPGAAQTPAIMPGIGSALPDAKVADCLALQALDGRLATAAAASLTMPSTALDAEIRAINATFAQRQAVATKLQAAYSAASIAMAREVASAAVEVVLAGCILTPPSLTCIASVYGIKLVAGTANSAVQLFNARTAAEQRAVAIGFAKSRVGLFVDLAADLEPRPYHKAAKVALDRIAAAGQALYATGATLAAAKNDLDGAIAALATLESEFGRAVVNEASYRRFRQTNYLSQRWLVQVLLMSYAASGCSVPGGVIPAPSKP